MTGISIAGVHKSFGHKTVLDHVSLDVEDGEFVCLLGPSGCGKTTLLRAIAGLETPEDGTISLGSDVVFDHGNGVNRAPEHRELGMVFQSFALWPHKTVFDNAAYPLKRAKVARGEIAERVRDALTMVDLWELRNAYPGTLSGGQQQRVALARAVVARPRILLLDEPLSSLDTNLRAQMRREIRGIQQHLGATAVYVTHDKEDAGGLADRVIVLQDGHIVQQGTPPEVFVAPRTAFVAEFVGFDNFFEATVVDGPAHTVEVGAGHRIPVASTGALHTGDTVTVAVRSRVVTVSALEAGQRASGFSGSVVSKVHLGDDVEIVVNDGIADLVARVRPEATTGIQIGQRVDAVPAPGSAVVVEGSRRGGSQSTQTVRTVAHAEKGS